MHNNDDKILIAFRPMHNAFNDDIQLEFPPFYRIKQEVKTGVDKKLHSIKIIVRQKTYNDTQS